MKILVACEESGTVRDAFAAKGHEAWSCDLKPARNGGNHYQGSIFDILNDGWDMMIAHPPCCDLAVSGAAWFKQKQADGRQQASIEFFMKMVNALMSGIYRKPDQIISPHHFGDDAKKPTCLWLKNLPKLVWIQKDDLFSTKTMIEPEMVTMTSKKTGRTRTYSKWEYEASCDQKNRKEIRSKTFPE